jgi:hypothetical protein
MAISVFGVLYLDILAYIGCIVAVIYCRYEAIIAVITSYSYLGTA